MHRTEAKAQEGYDDPDQGHGLQKLLPRCHGGPGAITKDAATARHKQSAEATRQLSLNLQRCRGGGGQKQPIPPPLRF